MIHRFAIFQKRFTALGADEVEREFIAVPMEQLHTGIFIPSSHPDIDPTELTEVEAGSAEEAVQAYREMIQDMYM
jgi:hypothetical protein